MSLRSFLDRIFSLSMISPVKASVLNKLTEPRDTISGVVQNIGEGSMNSITFQIQSDNRIFYISRGIEQGIAITFMQKKLTGHCVTICYPKSANSNPLQHIPISEIIFHNEIIFTEIG